MKYQFTNLHM